MQASIDVNSDLGEGFGRWTLGDDEQMLELVTSANVACGFHAGDPRAIRTTLAAAAQRGVVVGAHVGYRDLAGFGRRAMDVGSDDLVADVVYQIGALQALARAEGCTVRYVKPHGALYNTIVHDERQAADVVEAILLVDPSLIVLGLPDSALLHLAAEAGMTTAAEAFADRAYTSDGTLVPRGTAGAVLDDPEAIAERMVDLATSGSIEAIDGSRIRLRADSICVHGDSPGSVQIAQAVRRTLQGAGVELASFSPPAGRGLG